MLFIKVFVINVIISLLLFCSQTKPQIQDEQPIQKSSPLEDKKEEVEKEINTETKDRSLNRRVSVWNHEGWAGKPEDFLNGEDMFSIESGDHYYKKAIGSASSRSIELNSPSYMQSTCKINASKNNLNSTLESLYKSVLIDRENEEKNGNIKKLIDVSGDLEARPLLCRPIGKGAKFTECECIVYIYYKGGKEEAYKDIRRRLEIGVDRNE